MSGLNKVAPGRVSTPKTTSSGLPLNPWLQWDPNPHFPGRYFQSRRHYYVL